MPTPVSDRFRLEVRLGRDGDIEEWLATDTELDRPVLIRQLGPESSPERRRAFVEAVQKASTVSHLHLASIYMVEEVEGGAYSVSEWTGGATLQARLEAGDTIEADEFLPNAAGLASALAALHEAGVVHGGIDLGAITYTVAHPAKLGSFGRIARGATIHGDVRSLAEVLEQSLTGAAPGTSPPSELIDGLSSEVDRILREGRRGTMAARTLAEAFAGAPTPRRPQPESTRPSRRLLIAATTTTSVPPTTTTIRESANVEIGQVATFDPFGGGGENDDMVEALIDGDLGTSWRTETYLDPLPLLKPGVGIAVDVDGSPRDLELLGLSDGASLELRWAQGESEDLADYEVVGRLVSQPGTTAVRLPPRDGGRWLIWFTDLPPLNGDFAASVAEIRFGG